MLFEVCCQHAADSLRAQQAGAQRIELCRNLDVGGLTPETEEIILARKYLSIPLHIMIRPQSRTLHYSESDIQQMESDIQKAKNLGADGVVFGLLNAYYEIDLSLTSHLTELANPLHVTFHRAFDAAKNPADALERIVAAGCNTLLTSGGRSVATEGKVVISQLVQQSKDRITIMAGSGINSENVIPLIQATKVKAVHASARITINGQKEMSSDLISEISKLLNLY